MRETHYRALLRAPVEDGQVPGGPVFDTFRAGIVLIDQAEQNEMAGVTRWEAGNFKIVMHQLVVFRIRVIFTREVPFLMVVAWAPGEHGADVEFFALNLADHGLRGHTLAGVLIVATAGRVEVMIPGVPLVARRIDPARHPERQLDRRTRVAFRHHELFRYRKILRPH